MNIMGLSWNKKQYRAKIWSTYLPAKSTRRVQGRVGQGRVAVLQGLGSTLHHVEQESKL